MTEISLHSKVFDIVKAVPEARQVIIDLGFVHMKDDAMLYTAGKIMTLAKACLRHKVTYQQLQEAFEKINVKFKEETL